jgi:hypothetical protein
LRGGDHPAFAAPAILLDMALTFMLCSFDEIDIPPTPAIRGSLRALLQEGFSPDVIVYFV